MERKSFDKLTRTEKIAGTSHAVGPMLELKVAHFFKNCPKSKSMQFDLKSDGFLNCPKSRHTFWLHLNENLLPRTLKKPNLVTLYIGLTGAQIAYRCPTISFYPLGCIQCDQILRNFATLATFLTVTGILRYSFDLVFSKL